MRRLAALSLLLLPATALAGWPTDVYLSEMGIHDGIRATEPLTEEYRTLVMELGTTVANPAVLPTDTMGAWGFDFAAATTFVFIDAYDDSPTGWQRSHRDGTPDTYLFVPTMMARKGLPMSFEVGVNGGWIGGSHTGMFGGYGRLALVEGYKPYPDVSLSAGYAGYLGNDELDLGVMDFQVNLGSEFKLYRLQGITYSLFSPFLNFSMLRVTAAPRVDDGTIDRLGLVQYGGTDSDEAPILIPRLATGFQISNGKVLGRLAVSWAPPTVPTLTFGMGFAL